MGARIESADGKPPLRVLGGAPLKAIDYAMPIASAQVKSAVMLAGLYAQGVTRVTEPAITRDHTERMLSAFGAEVGRDGATVSIAGGQRLRATSIDVPADISSAAFFMVGASIAPGSDITLQHVGVNPTRTGIIDILRAMGADITLSNEKLVGGEPVADIRVRYVGLHGIDVDPALVPLAIDEFPVLFIAAACAQGTTRLGGAAELRVKESDRIAVMEAGLHALGADASATPVASPTVTRRLSVPDRSIRMAITGLRWPSRWPPCARQVRSMWPIRPMSALHSPDSSRPAPRSVCR